MRGCSTFFFRISRSALGIRGFLQILQLPKDATDILIFFHQLFFRWLPEKCSTSVWIHLDGPQHIAHQNALKVHPTIGLIWPAYKFITLQWISCSCFWNSFWVCWPIFFFPLAFHRCEMDVKINIIEQKKNEEKNHRASWQKGKQCILPKIFLQLRAEWKLRRWMLAKKCN